MSANGKFSMDDYIDVAERIAEFDKRYPEGSLQTINWTVEKVDDQTFIVYRAAAYRTPEDPRPGHGIAWEPFPGRTPYTRDSELMNAETSAWGRAIVACGLTSNRKIASRQEVQARAAVNGDQNGGHPEGTNGASQSQPSAAPPKPSERPASAKQRGLIEARARAIDLTAAELANVLRKAGGEEPTVWQDGAAERWSARALDRLPARLVDDVLAGIAAKA